MITKEIDVLNVQELIWLVPKKLINDDHIIEELQRNNGRYRFISLEDHDEEWYTVKLWVVSDSMFETINDLITDCQYKLSYLFDKLTIQNSVIIPSNCSEI